MNLPSLADQKADLRKRCYAERIAIDADQAAAAAQAIAARVAEHVALKPGSVVSAYWPLEGELDPRPALRALVEQGAAAALPRVLGNGQPLDFHAWQPGDHLIEGRFKVMEPASSTPKASPTILLVPLLAFDQGCRRLGHGKGYYDRTLERLRKEDPAVQAIGIAFAAQEVARVPTDAFDQPLNMVITENAVYRPA